MQTTKTNFCAAVSDSLSAALTAIKNELGAKSNAELLAALTAQYAAQKAEIAALKKKTEGAVNPFLSEKLDTTQKAELVIKKLLTQKESPITGYSVAKVIVIDYPSKTRKEGKDGYDYKSVNRAKVAQALKSYAAEIAAHMAENPHLYK